MQHTMIVSKRVTKRLRELLEDFETLEFRAYELGRLHASFLPLRFCVHESFVLDGQRKPRMYHNQNDVANAADGTRYGMV